MTRPRQAFTLIELVASAVLAAMMMVALMNVVWSATRDARQLQDAELARSSVTLLADRLRADFQNARGITTQGGVITLHGYLSEHPNTLDPTHLPATVQYLSAQGGTRRLLIRRAVSPSGSKSEPVWIGFGSLRIEPLSEPDPDDKLAPDPAAGGLPAMPASLRVTLSGSDGQILWREVLHHHEV